MSLLSRVSSAYRALVGPPAPAAQPSGRAVQGRYDAAQTTSTNRDHWGKADALAPVWENTPAVRRTLRNRSRHEFNNSSYCKGLLTTLTADVVGTGPRLQAQSPDQFLNAAIELAWKRWADAVNLPHLFRVLELSRRRDGECFLVFASTDRLAGRTPVRLWPRLVEADQVADANGGALRTTGEDGVNVDGSGQVVSYNVLRVHPGDGRGLTGLGVADTVPASQVVHWAIFDRPGQLRQIPELTPALELFAVLRRYTKASLLSAEYAASIVGVLEQDAPPGAETTAAEAFDLVDVPHNQLMTLPAGAKLSQLKPEQPTTQHGDFVRSNLREIGRAVDAPYGVTAGDSSSYNYSSARLDHQTHDLRRAFERDQFRLTVLMPLFLEWLKEARLVVPELIGKTPDPAVVPVCWHFDARPSIDPVKDATADEMCLRSGKYSLAEVCAADGKDWLEVARQRAKEAKQLTALGLPVPWVPPAPAPAAGQPATGNSYQTPDPEAPEETGDAAAD